VRHLSGVPLKGRLLASHAKIRLAREKHSSLLQTSINYGCEKFLNIEPRRDIKLAAIKGTLKELVSIQRRYLHHWIGMKSCAHMPAEIFFVQSNDTFSTCSALAGRLNLLSFH
jgi:hypothetical protein